MKRRVIGVLLGLALASPLAAAVPGRPQRYATDLAGVIDAARLSALNERLAQFERDTSNQVLVYVDRRLPAGTTLEEFATTAFTSWGVGQKGTDNGVVLFVFVDDRKVRIEVGYGLEGAIPDARATRIREDALTPRFRAGDYAGGIEAVADELMKAARGEPYRGSGQTVAEGPGSSLSGWFWLVPLLALAGGGLAARGSAPRPDRLQRAGIVVAVLLAALSMFAGPVLGDIRAMAVGFGLLLVGLAGLVAWMIGRDTNLTGRRRLGLGVVQVAAALVIGGFGLLCLAAAWNGFAGPSGLALLAGFPLLPVGGLLASREPWRSITLTILGLSTPVFLVSTVLAIALWYNGVPDFRIAVDVAVVSGLVWAICKTIARSRGWTIDVGSSTYSGSGRSGGWSSGSGSSSWSSSSSSSGSSFSGGGGRSGGGGSSGSW